jgi:proteasome component ECM29
VRSSVQSALTSMAIAYRGKMADPIFAQRIRKILLDNIDKESTQARFASVKYANSLYAFSEPVARYICLLAASDPKLEVREQGMAGLDFPSKDIIDENEARIPDLGYFLKFLAEMNRSPRPHIVRLPGTSWIGSVTIDTYIFTLLFLHQILLKSIDADMEIGKLAIGGDEKMTLPHSDIKRKIRDGLKEFLIQRSDALKDFIHYIETGLTDKSSNGYLQSISSFYLLEVISLSPPSLAEFYYDRSSWFLGLSTSANIDAKINICRTMAIIFTSNLQIPERVVILKDVIRVLLDWSVETADYDRKLASLIGLGFISSRLSYRNSSILEIDERIKIFKIIAQAINSSRATDYIVGGCIAIGEIGRYSAFPEEIIAEFESVFVQLQVLVKSSESKIQEVALAAIGSVSIGNPTMIEKVFDFYIDLPSILSKQTEILFNIGESVCGTIFGFIATNMEEYLDISDQEIMKRDEIDREKYLDKILGLVSPTQNAVSKKAACVWLLCLVKYCGSSLKSYLLRFHDSFSQLLGDKDDFTQEIASKGIVRLPC